MKYIIVFTMIISSSILSTQVFAGRETGNGGDLCEVEFLRIADDLLEAIAINTKYTKLKNETSATNLSALTVLRGTIKPTATLESLVLRGRPVDAINYPSTGVIEFNRTRWLEAANSDKVRLVMHEILGLAQIEDPSYKSSSQIISSIGHPTKIGLAVCAYGFCVGERILDINEKCMNAKVDAIYEDGLVSYVGSSCRKTTIAGWIHKSVDRLPGSSLQIGDQILDEINKGCADAEITDFFEGGLVAYKGSHCSSWTFPGYINELVISLPNVDLKVGDDIFDRHNPSCANAKVKKFYEGDYIAYEGSGCKGVTLPGYVSRKIK